MSNYHIFVFVGIFIGLCGSSGVTRKSLSDVPKNFETCKSELGVAKDTIEIVKQFYKQDPSSLGNTNTEIKRVDSELEQLRSIIKKVGDKQNGGATYTRWGKTTCKGKNIETVYSGQVGGGLFNHGGSSVNYICLPNDPDQAHQLRSSEYDYLYGGEYKVYKHNSPYRMKSGLGSHDVPCAVCRTYKRSSTLMIPGRRRCYKDWTKEYNGYLMAGYYGHAKGSEYACVDINADTVPGGSASQIGVLFYPVKVRCGSLKCPPYTEGTDVPCVVCTK